MLVLAAAFCLSSPAAAGSPEKVSKCGCSFKGLELKGIYGREMFETWYKMAGLIQSGLDLKPMITHTLPVDDFQEGFDIMRSGQSGKVILDWA